MDHEGVEPSILPLLTQPIYYVSQESNLKLGATQAPRYDPRKIEKSNPMPLLGALTP